LTKPFIDIQQQIEQGISILRKGGLVAYPTDTVYGLGAAMNHPQAVQRIFLAKGRPSNLPLPLLLADVAQIADVADSVPPSAQCFLRNFFPGGLTLVLPKSRAVPSLVTGGGDTVAVRVPDHPVPVALIKGLGVPIVGTSANRSGQPSVMTAAEVAQQLGNRVDLIIDGGRCPGGKESTIVDVTGEIPVILREGAISREELERVCGHIIIKIYPERSRREESK
jgi:L-threonylcarbamoyladenylate synthase